MQRGRSSEETGSIGDPLVATETGQTTGEGGGANQGTTDLESPARSPETTADGNNEAPTITTEEVANHESGTIPSLEGLEGKQKPREGGESSEPEGTGLDEEHGGHKDEPSKQGGEGELGLPLVATDITCITCRAGEKVTGVLR